MRKYGFTGLCAIMLALSGQGAMANAAYQQELARLDSDAQTFVQVQNYVSVDPDTLTDQHYYSADNFLHAPGSAISWPDANLDAVSRAILILEANEVRLPHVRYLIQYSMNQSPDFPEVQHAYLDVTRFNLGPARRADLLGFVSEEHLAPAAEFGVGPHVSWRFVMAPVMGMQAGLMYASRFELSNERAENADCLGEPCLSLLSPEGPAYAWNPVAAPGLAQAPYVFKSQSGSTRPARVVEELWASMTADGMDPLPYKLEQPHFVFVVSSDVGGQDAMVSGLAKQAMVMDHTTAEIWVRRDEVALSPAEFAIMYVPRQ